MKKFFKVTVLSGVLTLFRMLVGFVIAKVIAIYTGPAGMAMLGQLQNFVGALIGITSAPVGNGIVRFTAQNKEEGFEICSGWWRASLQWVLGILLILIPLGIWLSPTISIWLFDRQEFTWLIIISFCVLPFSATGTLCNSIINGFQLYKRYFTLALVTTLLSSSLMLLMVYSFDIQGALFAASVQSALIGAAMLIANLKQPWLKLQYWWGKTEKSHRNAIAQYILMAIVSAVCVPAAMIFVRTMLIEQVGWDNAGQWQAVWKISDTYLSVITISLTTYYLPRLSSLKDANAIINEINKTFWLVMPVVVLLAISIYFLRDIIILILFTEEFRNARDLFAVQLVGDVVKIASWIYSFPMISRGATKWFISTEIVFSTFFVILSYVLISKMGLKGVLFAYLINYLMYFIFMFFSIKKIVK